MFEKRYVHSTKFYPKLITISTSLKEFDRTLSVKRQEIHLNGEFNMCIVCVSVWMITKADIGTLFVVEKS